MDNPCKWLDDLLWDNITELDKLAIHVSTVMTVRDCINMYMYMFVTFNVSIFLRLYYFLSGWVVLWA